MLKGFMNISSDPRLCFEFSQNDPNTKIISLDEDNIYMELNPENNKNVIMGTILLPPIEVQWAELDGDVQKFKELYFAHMTSPQVEQFIYTLIGYVYMGGNIIFYCPNDDASGLDISPSIGFILEYIEKGFGIHLGTGPQDTFKYDPSCIPMYYIGIYGLNIINTETFLIGYPLNATIPETVYYKIIMETGIYGENLNDKVEYINLWRHSLCKSGRKKSVLINAIR